MDREARLQVEDTEQGRRMDSFLAARLEAISRSHLQKLIGSGSVLLNGQACLSKNHRLTEGDEITVFLPEAERLQPAPEKMSLEIVYEDSDLLVINKPAGLVVHPAPGCTSGTLVNGLLALGCPLSGVNGPLRPGIVHRLDKDTSGLMVVAKTDGAHLALAEQFQTHQAGRIYEAVTVGVPKMAKGTIDAPLGRHPKDRLKRGIVPDGRRAVTHYEVLETFSGFARVRCQLETGRTHQIRVHMAFIGHPLLGDPLYNPYSTRITYTGQALHGGILRFNHPTGGEALEFQVPPPEAFEKLLIKLRSLR